jgi:hypothetical protein
MFMQSSKESSIWRSLAVAFGDGLAFGIGVKLSQNAARQMSSAHRLEAAEANDRRPLVAPPPPAIDCATSIPAADPKPVLDAKPGLDQKVLEAIVNALEARLREQSGLMDRRLADLEAKLTLELKGLEEQDHSMAAQAARDLSALEGHLVALNREFGEAVAGIVAEQVAAQVETRTAAAERALEERIATAVEERVSHAMRTGLSSIEWRLAEIDAASEQRLAASVRERLEPLERRLAEMDAASEQRVAASVRERLEPMERQLREEIGCKEREIAELRQQLAAADTNLLEIVSGIGQVCRQAAERMANPPGPAPVPDAVSAALAEEPEIASHDWAGGRELEGPADSSGETAVPGFAQPQKPNRLWRVPLVSSLVLLVTGGLMLIRYL